MSTRIEVDKIFKSHDFGFDLELVSAESWSYDNNHYHRQVYLENIEKNSLPIPATFHIYIEDDGKVRKIVVEM